MRLEAGATATGLSHSRSRHPLPSAKTLPGDLAHTRLPQGDGYSLARVGAFTVCPAFRAEIWFQPKPDMNGGPMRRQVWNIAKVAGLVALAIIGTIYLINPKALAADKGGPPTKIDAQGNEKPLFSGCYGQLGAGGVFASGNDTIKGFAVGAGCDWQVGTLVIGANGRYAFYEDDARSLTIGGRLGYAINPHTLAYGTVSVLMDGRNPQFHDSAIMGGIGLETYLSKNMTVFLEAATDIQKWGDWKTLPQVYEIHGGLRIRF